MTGLDVNDPRVYEPDGFLTCLEKSDMPIAEAQWRRLLEQRIPVSLEARIKSPQSTQDRIGPIEHNYREQWILTTAISDQDADGRLLGITGCITDITTQKRSTQDALERASLSEALLKSRADADASEQKFAKFAQIAPVGIFSCNVDGDYVYCNDTWYNTLKLDRKFSGVETYLSVAAEIGFEADMNAIIANWKSLVVGKTATALECRTSRMWTPPDSPAGSNQVHQWVRLADSVITICTPLTAHVLRSLPRLTQSSPKTVRSKGSWVRSSISRTTSGPKRFRNDAWKKLWRPRGIRRTSSI